MTEKLVLLVEGNGDIRMASLDTGMDLEMIAKDEGLKRVKADRAELDDQILGRLENYKYDFENQKIVKKEEKE